MLGSDLLAERVADLIADERGEEAPDEDDRQVELALGGEQPGGEEQRVAREEEPDQQARLGEDDRDQTDRPEGPDDVLRIQAELRQHVHDTRPYGAVAGLSHSCHPCSFITRSTSTGGPDGWSMRTGARIP